MLHILYNRKDKAHVSGLLKRITRRGGPGPVLGASRAWGDLSRDRPCRPGDVNFVFRKRCWGPPALAALFLMGYRMGYRMRFTLHVGTLHVNALYVERCTLTLYVLHKIIELTAAFVRVLAGFIELLLGYVPAIQRHVKE
jgi:hypothetical protein